MVDYLYLVTPPEIWSYENGKYGATLITKSLEVGNWKIALNLLQYYPNLTLAMDINGKSPVLTVATTAYKKEKAQVHIKKLEEEVKLLKNLNHPNIFGYLGTVRDEDTVNILLEYVPSGSISSLLGKFGAFNRSLVQISSSMLKDASKQVVELATMTGANSMRGTPYWMAPEVIL